MNPLRINENRIFTIYRVFSFLCFSYVAKQFIKIFLR